MHLHPTREQFEQLQELPQDQPIVMLNLLRYADQAHEGHGCDGMTGAEAYAEYGRRLRALPPEIFTGEPYWFGQAHATIIGATDEQWDQMLLVRYASVQAFVHMATHPDYLEAAKARTAALDDSRLVLLTDANAG